jgi:hypothetical protein
MYLRRTRRRKKGGTYEYWTLVESVRTAKGPRQRIVATIGKEPGLDEDTRHGWEDITRLLDGDEGEAAAAQGDLFEPEVPQRPLWVEANLSGMRVERLREFGKPYVSLALWRRLHLHRFFEKHLPRGKERIGWDQIAFILSCGRFCEQASELALAEKVFKVEVEINAEGKAVPCTPAKRRPNRIGHITLMEPIYCEPIASTKTRSRCGAGIFS